jgi:D-beta-D-heptose 7-phosphate kinase/D-beta-D-heptose 1-phosphate adenosyltransferase
MSKIVFTNGCFDILHVGHIRLLDFAKSLGTKLIVGLNSDKSIKKLKGFSRPINCEQDRKEILLSNKNVDNVIIFDEDTPLELIKNIKPDIIVKGGDYKETEVVGYGLSKIIIFDYLNGYSTTKIIKSISDR